MIEGKRLSIFDAVVVVAAVALILGVTYYYGRQTQNAAVGYNTYSSYDAAGGGYRAWFELLDREGVRVARFERRPGFLDGTIDTYVIASNLYEAIARSQVGADAEVMTTGDWDAVARWVRAGGRLVWLADGQSEPDQIGAPDAVAKGPKVDEAVPVARTAATAGVRGVSGTSALRVPFGASFSAAPLVADDVGGVVVSYPLGRGTVTIVTDESLFSNARIAKADNARLAYDVATAGLPPRGLVAFDEWSHGYAAGDSWWSILPRQFQVALIALGVAIVLVAIPPALRFGPTARLPDEQERTSAAYLASMATLYQRGGAVRTAIEELVDSCMRDVADSVGLAETARARQIAQRLGDPDGEGGSAAAVMEIDRIRSYEYPHAADLLRAAQSCAELRKECTRHGRIAIRRRPHTSRGAA